jgi:hypothetical protein
LFLYGGYLSIGGMTYSDIEIIYWLNKWVTNIYLGEDTMVLAIY